MFILFILNFICMVICLVLARKKNLNRMLWVLLGGLFGPIAILVALFLPSRDG